MDDATRRWVEKVAAGTDALVDGTPAEALAAIERAMPALAGLGDVIVAASIRQELSLSSLIAQISGHTDVGGQDDAVLELGFRRLTGPSRTILILQAPVGVSRSALRYLQHVKRQAPELVLVATASESLHALLAEPVFAALAARLRVPPAIARAVAPPLPAPPRSVRSHRRAAFWVGAAIVGATASASAAFVLVHNPAPTRLAAAAVPATLPALVLQRPPAAPLATPPQPRLATAAPPTLVGPAPGERAETPPGPLARAAAPAVLASLPPLLPPLAERNAMARRPEPPRTETAHADAAHPEPARVARAHPAWLPPRYREPARYAGEEFEPPPGQWSDPEPWRRPPPYLGTYTVDPYGMRVFSYDR